MKRKLNFMYEEERFSFLNIIFSIIMVFITLILIGFMLIISDLFVSMEIIIVLIFIYGFFGYRTFALLKERNMFKKKGRRCAGTIVGISIDEDCTTYVDDDFDITENIYLVVEYTNPFTNCTARFVSKPVYGNPYNHLSSLKVSVYVLENGKGYVTNFKKIIRRKDAIRYHDKRLKEIDKKEDVNR